MPGKRRLERLEKRTAPRDEFLIWRRIIINDGDPLPPGLGASESLIVRVIVDPKGRGD